MGSQGTGYETPESRGESTRKAFDDTQKTAISELLVKRLEEWASWRQQNWEPRWQRAWERHRNAFLKEATESEGTDWRSSVVFGMIRQKGRVALSLMSSNVLETGSLPFDLNQTPVGDSEDSQAHELLGVDPKERVQKMKRLIKDQLVESKMAKHMFASMNSQIYLGTGVLKGPFTTHRKRNRWVPVIPPELESGLPPIPPEGDPTHAEVLSQIKDALKGQVTYKLEQTDVPSPTLKFVDLWDYYPDMSSDNPQSGYGVFERAVLSRTELAALSLQKDENGQPMYDQEAIKELLDRGARQDYGSSDKDAFISSRGPHREDYTGRVRDYYSVMTYCGSISLQDQKDEGRTTPGIGSETKIDDYIGKEYIIVFCRKKVLSIRENPSQRGLRPYHAAPFFKIPGCPFGWGLSDEMDHAHSAYNGFLRLFIDNKKLSGSVGIAVNESLLENPNFEIEPGFKVRVRGGADVRSAVMPITIPDIGGNLLQAMEFCERWGNSSSGIPSFLDGDETKQKERTAYETSELKSSALKQLGIPIRYIDEEQVVPIVEGFYDWNMMYSQDEEVKGDFEVHAQGYMSFRDKNVKSAELRGIMAMKANDPELSDYVKSVDILREISKIGEFSEDRFVRSDKEVDEIRQKRMSEQQSAGQQAEQARMQAEQELLKQKMELQAQKLEADTAMLMAKLETQMKLEKEAIKAEFQMALMKMEHDLTSRQQGAMEKEPPNEKDAD